MECTQRLEYTQELNDFKSERVCPEQIAFLGICGEKYPVKKGPNKIGRDPSTCSIVINLNSVSRQHAVINVLGSNEYMLMDLDSANKTKLMNKTLQPYIPHPLKNGDMVQFGDIFGVFRLLEDDNDLPMTQAIDIPETPMSARHVSKLNKAAITTIPESPDVSDRDDSFIAPSQPKNDKCFRNTKSNFLKPSSNLISIQPVGNSKIDNIYWSSTKKSVSLNSHLEESTCDLNESKVSVGELSHDDPVNIHDMETQPFVIDEKRNHTTNDDSIHNMETQAFISDGISKKCNLVSIYDMETQRTFPDKNSTSEVGEKSNIHERHIRTPLESKNISKDKIESIYDMQTQVLTNGLDHSIDSIYTADTQIPNCSPSIHSLSTQVPGLEKNNLPAICKINSQKNMEVDLFSLDKQKEPISTDNQCSPIKTDDLKINLKNPIFKSFDKCMALNTSEEELMFEEIQTQNIDENYASQTLLPLLDELPSNAENKSFNKSSKITHSCATEKRDLDSDSSTDCEYIDMLPTQKISGKEDDDLTDCEDLFEELPKTSKINKESDNFEDILTQVIDADIYESKVNNESKKTVNKTLDDISDMPTQLLSLNDKEIVIHKDTIKNDVDFEDLPTQVITDNIDSKTVTEKPLESPFKIPLISPIKVKRKDIKHIEFTEISMENNVITPNNSNYYACTQDLLNDLCSQPVPPKDKPVSKKLNNDGIAVNHEDDEIVPCSVEDYQPGMKFPHLESPVKNLYNISEKITTSQEADSIKNFVSKLTSDQIKDVIGIETSAEKLNAVSTDPSDVECTPKKVRPIKFMDIDLPDSQEIKNIVSLKSKASVTESSSESEPENDSEEQCTPILFHNKKVTKKTAKIDLTKKFDAETLPSRVITRVRRPPSKLLNIDVDTKKISNNILKSKFLTEQEDEIDRDIITENISRLKSKRDKHKKKEIGHKTSSGDSTRGKENDSKEVETKYKSETSKTKTTSSKDGIKVEKNIKTPEENKGNKEKPKSKETNKNKSEKPASIRKKGEMKTLTTNEIEESINRSNENTNTSKSKRSTRARRKVNTEEPVIVINCDTERKRKPRTRKETSKNPVEHSIDLTESVPDIRRSKRQRTSKEKKEEKLLEAVEKVVPKSILKKAKESGFEQSTVYNVSSESGVDSPKSIKRTATNDLWPQSSKRSRSNAVNNNRSTPIKVHQTQYVLFTAFPCEEVRAKLEKLGAVIVTDVMTCTVVLTLQIKRTFKLLCALGLGRPIVGPDWVQACADSNMIVDPWLYVLKDEAAEQRFRFSLDHVLRSKRNFLKGFNVSATPNVMPSATEMKLIVECSGGTWKEGGPQWVCVSCTADKALWPTLKKKGALVVTTEFILGGVLRQRAEITSNKL